MQEKQMVTDVESVGRNEDGRVVARVQVDLGEWREVVMEARWLGSTALLEHGTGLDWEEMPIDVGERDADEDTSYGATAYAVLMGRLEDSRLLPERTGMTLAELDVATFRERNDVVPGLIAEGLTILAGNPKVGKSWMLYDLALAAAEGGVFLGRQVTTPRTVLYLSLEDNLRRMQDRLRQLSIGRPLSRAQQERVEVQTAYPPFAEGGMQLLQRWTGEHRQRHALILIDTLHRMRAGERRLSSRNAYEADAEAMASVLDFAHSDPGLSIVVAHHLKKGAEEDFLARVSGSIGITGTADTTIVLTRRRGSDRGKMEVTGRDIHELERAMRFDGTRWHDLGDADEIAESAAPDTASAKLLRAMDEGGPGSVPEIAERAGVKLDTARRLLTKLKSNGEVSNLETGVWSTQPVSTS